MTIGGQDPADAAMAYGWANGALGALWYPLVEGFHIVDGRARVRLDLEAPAVSLRGRASLSLKLGQICRLAVFWDKSSAGCHGGAWGTKRAECEKGGLRVWKKRTI